MSYFYKVKDFMRAVNQYVPDRLTSPRPEQSKLRYNMLCAEFAELMCAMHGIEPEHLVCKGLKYKLNKEIAEVIAEAGTIRNLELTNLAHQIADLHYVLSGVSVDHGIPEEAVFDAIHEANMAKVGGPKRDDGKQLPPPGWEPANIGLVMQEFYKRGSSK